MPTGLTNVTTIKGEVSTSAVTGQVATTAVVGTATVISVKGFTNTPEISGVIRPITIQGTAMAMGAVGTFDDTFETVSKNLKGYPYTLTYSSGRLASIVYTIGADTITKAFSYAGDLLSTIVLSGDIPTGIETSKTFTYSGEQLSGVSYS